MEVGASRHRHSINSKKKMLVTHTFAHHISTSHCSLTLFTYIICSLTYICSLTSFEHELHDVVLDFVHQGVDGHERAPQCFGLQYAFQLRRLCGVNAGVLRRGRRLAGLVGISHPGGFGCAPVDFLREVLHQRPRVVGAGVGGGAGAGGDAGADFGDQPVAHCAQFAECERRAHNDGDRNVNCFGSWFHVAPLGVSGRAVRGAGLCKRSFGGFGGHVSFFLWLRGSNSFQMLFEINSIFFGNAAFLVGHFDCLGCLGCLDFCALQNSCRKWNRPAVKAGPNPQ